RVTPSASNNTASEPNDIDTSRACHVPTPNVANDAYSNPVNTGARKIGFQASIRHCPNSARLRALCVQAPSSCQTTPTVVRQGGSAVGKIVRRPTASSINASNAATNVRVPTMVTLAVRPSSGSVSVMSCEIGQPSIQQEIPELASGLVVGAEPVEQPRIAE